MKWYPRDPSAWLAGVIGLDAEERGFYDTVIDLLYARDGKDVTDALVCSALDCRPQTWRRVKAKLIQKGKICENATGALMANRVETTLQTSRKLAAQMSVLRRQQLQNQEVIFGGYARKPKPRYSYLTSPSLDGEKGKEESSSRRSRFASLSEIVKSKGWSNE